MPVVTCEMLFQELMIVADLLYSPAQTSPVLTAPIHKQKIKVQSWRFVCFTRSCSEVRQAVNDRVLLTFPIIYLFGIANSVAVDALWQLSYTLSPHVLLRNSDGKSSAKAKGWKLGPSTHHRLWHLLCYLLIFFLTSKYKKILFRSCILHYWEAFLPVKESSSSLLEIVGASNQKLTLTWQEDREKGTDGRTTWKRDKLP